MQRIFIIKDRFDIKGKGVALTGITEDDSLVLQPGDRIKIKRQGFADLETTVLGFELLRNCWAPQKPKNMAILVPAEIEAKNVPPDSEVWA